MARKRNKCKWNKAKTICEREDGTICRIKRAFRSKPGRRYSLSVAFPGPNGEPYRGSSFTEGPMNKKKAIEICQAAVLPQWHGR